MTGMLGSAPATLSLFLFVPPAVPFSLLYCLLLDWVFILFLFFPPFLVATYSFCGHPGNYMIRDLLQCGAVITPRWRQKPRTAPLPRGACASSSPVGLPPHPRFQAGALPLRKKNPPWYFSDSLILKESLKFYLSEHVFISPLYLKIKSMSILFPNWQPSSLTHRMGHFTPSGPRPPERVSLMDAPFLWSLSILSLRLWFYQFYSDVQRGGFLWLHSTTT